MEDIIPNDGALGTTKCIDATQVTHHALTQVMNPIETDVVPFCRAWPVAPIPTGRNAGVEEISNLVVCHNIVAAKSNPHANRTRQNATPMSDEVVVDRDVMRKVRLVVGHSRVPNAHAAGAHIFDQAVFQQTIAATRSKPDAVRTDM